MTLPLMALAALMAQTPQAADCPRQAAKAVAVAGAPFAQIAVSVDDEKQDPQGPKARAQGPKDAKDAKEAKEAQEAQERFKIEWRQHDIEIQEALKQLPKELEKAGVTRQFVLDQIYTPGVMQSFRFNHGAEPRICLEIDNLPIRDAIQKVFKGTKYEFTIDDGVCKDGRITLKVPNVRLSTALDMITEAGGAYWTTEMRIPADATPKLVYRVQRTPGNRSVMFVNPDGAGKGHVIANIGAPPAVPGMETSVKGFSMIFPEKRSKFTCPHCHGTATIVRETTKPGAKRYTTAAKPWKFCPLCGKPVEDDD